MSFLGDLVNSIGNNKSPPIPPPLPKPVIKVSNPPSSTVSNLATKPKTLHNVATSAATGQKRKFDDKEVKASKILERPQKSNPAPVPMNKTVIRTDSRTLNGPKPSTSKVSISTASAESSTTKVVAGTGPAKSLSKGSYAEMMARAKEAQQTRPQKPIGTIKHQATSKEKISKLAERRRLEQEKVKADKEKKAEKSTSTSKNDKRRETSPAKKNGQAKVPRAPRPPLHAPQSSYKGTMGTSSKKPQEQRLAKRSRYDEYLGTDEEDNSDVDGYDDDDGYGYGSDASSDMEAGLDDIDMEEQKALRAAKEDDAKELALENQLKREKDERKRKLLAMAKKGR